MMRSEPSRVLLRVFAAMDHPPVAPPTLHYWQRKGSGQAEERADLLSLVRDLTPDEVTLCRLRYAVPERQGRARLSSYAAVAATLGLTPRLVKRRLGLALAKIAAEIARRTAQEQGE